MASKILDIDTWFQRIVEPLKGDLQQAQEEFGGVFINIASVDSGYDVEIESVPDSIIAATYNMPGKFFGDVKPVAEQIAKMLEDKLGITPITDQEEWHRRADPEWRVTPSIRGEELELETV